MPPDPSLSTAHNAGEATQQREPRFAQAFESALLGMALIGPDGRFLHANPALCALLGYAEAELLARTVYEVAHPDDQGELRQLLAGDAPPGQLDRRYVDRHGQIIWVRLSLSFVRDSAGAPRCLVAQIEDVTGRKRAEQALHQNQRILQLFIEYAPAAIAMFDRDMRYLAASRRYLSDYHVPAATIVGRSHYEVFPDIPEHWKEIHRRCLAGAVEASEADPFPRADGTLDWVRWAIHPWYEAEGQIGGIVLFSEVITHQMWLEQQRAKLTERLDLAARAAGIGIWDWDIQKNESVWDSGLHALYGLSAGDSVGAYAAWLRGVHPDDRAGCDELAAAAMRGEREYDTEFRVLWPDGSVHWLKASGQVFRDHDGTPLRMVGVNYDITGLKQAEEQLRRRTEELEQLLDFLPDAIWIAEDSACRVVRGNQFANTLLGLREPDNVSQSAEQPAITLRHFLHGRELTPDELPLQAAVRSGAPQLDMELRIEQEGGPAYIFLGGAVPLFNPDGSTRGAVASFHDITARKRMEDELRRSNAELEQFAYVASHDLQEPLRAVAGMVQLLEKKYKGQLDERADEYVAHAVEAASRMQALINDLLAFSRVDRHGRSIEPVQASACLHTALQNLDVAVRESGAVIAADELPVVHADATQLAQLFQNLIGNAIKFRGERTPQIQIGVTNVDDSWQFSVRDNGIGIEAQYFERIFLVFQRLHTRREYPGTGIGLALCKKIVERHGGAMWVESQPGQGSTFYFTLPIRSRP